VNIGRNKNVDNDDAIENYGAAFETLFSVADYVAVNVSSPNTAGLRDLQRRDHLFDLLKHIQERNNVNAVVRSWFEANENESNNPLEQVGKPLLVKIAPDVSEADVEAIVDTALRCKIDGIIATNTTIDRDGLRSPDVESIGAGGLSGRPLADRSTQVIRHIYKHSKAKLPIVGVGGIFSAEDAFEKIAAGASLVQAYTGFIYSGPTFPVDVVRGVAEIIKERGFKSLDDAVGSAVK
jgi:dihydroorotate dehydrogenase